MAHTGSCIVATGLMTVLIILQSHNGWSYNPTEGVFLNMMESGLPNHYVLDIDDLGTTEDELLHCRSDSSRSDIGTWFYPNGSEISFESGGQVLYQERGVGIVSLYHDSLQGSAPLGIYRCEMPAENGVLHSAYIGLYDQDSGAPVISEEISFKALTTEDAVTPMFTLTLTSSGGPASSVVWTRDCVPLHSGSKHVPSLTLLDQESATYRHSLTVTDGASGVYKCIVINWKGSASVAVNFTSIQNDPPPEVTSEIECVWITFNGKLVHNNSIVDMDSIFIPDQYSVQCWTDGNTTTSGSWYYPDTTEVPIDSGAIFIQRNGDRVSYLSRVGGDVDGVYSCVIPGQDGGQQTLYIGIYDRSPETLGTPLIGEDIQFQQLDNQTVLLNCTSMGGPATDTFWTRDCIQIPDDDNHTSSKVLVDGESATYVNTLTITGECSGMYRCIVTNNRGAAVANFSCGGADDYSQAHTCNSIWLTHNGRVISNNSIVNLEDVTQEGKGTLKCWTDWQYCCNSIYTLDNEHKGHWYFPSGEQLSYQNTYLISGANIYRSRAHQVLLLHGRKGGMEGIYHCTIPNDTGESSYDLYVGLYGSSASTGIPIGVGEPQFRVLTEPDAENPLFSLTCISIGGPPTFVRWTRDGAEIPTGEDDGSYVITQRCIDTLTATYYTELTILGRLEGLYECVVASERGSSPTTVSFLIRAPATPSIQTASPAQTSVVISWNTQPVNHSDYTVIDFYEIHASPAEGSCAELNMTHVIVVVDGRDTQGTVTGLEENTTYVFTVVAVNGIGRSNHSEEQWISTLSSVPFSSPEAVECTATSSTSILVQWNPVRCIHRNSEIAYYLLRITNDMTVYVNSNDLQNELTGLIPYTNYSIEVAAVNSNGDIGPFSEGVITETQEDVPGPVELLSAIPLLTAIRVTWNPPHMPNGVITVYEVSYQGPVENGTVNTTSRSFELANLDPGGNYTFTVSGYTLAGGGDELTVYSTPIAHVVVENVQTELIDIHTVIVLWNKVDIPGTVVMNYTVYYRTLSDALMRTTNVPNESTQVFPPEVTHGIIRGLIPDQKYQFQVTVAVAVAGYFVESSRSAVTNDSVVTITQIFSTRHTICFEPGGLGGIVIGIFLITAIIFVVAFLAIICAARRRSGTGGFIVQKKPTTDSQRTELSNIHEGD